jgi:hypothetical protein
MRPGNLVALQWVDSSGCARGWQRMDEAEVPPPFYVNSVGWVVAADKVSITLAPHLGFVVGRSGDEQAQGMMTIPLRCVLRRQVLKISF